MPERRSTSQANDVTEVLGGYAGAVGGRGCPGEAGMVAADGPLKDSECARRCSAVWSDESHCVC